MPISIQIAASSPHISTIDDQTICAVEEGLKKYLEAQNYSVTVEEAIHYGWSRASSLLAPEPSDKAVRKNPKTMQGLLTINLSEGHGLWGGNLSVDPEYNEKRKRFLDAALEALGDGSLPSGNLPVVQIGGSSLKKVRL